MHKQKLTVSILAGIGVVSTILPWRIATIPFLGMELTFKGIDAWPGYVGIVLFVAAAALTMIGKKDQVLEHGIPKFGVLIVGGLTLLFFLFLEAAYAMNSIDSAAYGLHLGLLASVGIVVAPFLFKADGSVSIPSAKEVGKDIEQNAEVFEDQVEDIADQIEDKVEDVFEDDDDEDEKKSEEKEEKSEGE